MSVTGEKLPALQTVLRVMDTEARASGKRAQERVSPIVASQTPRKSGQTAAALRPRLSRTSTGVAISVGPSRGRRHSSGASIAEVVRWVNRGTGVYRQGGGDKRPITASARGRYVDGTGRRVMVLPGGKRVASVRGQRANKFMDRIRTLGTPAVERVFEQGAQQAARHAERVIG